MLIKFLQVLIFAGGVGDTAAMEQQGQVLAIWSRETPENLLEAVFQCESKTGAILSVKFSPLSNPPSPVFPTIAVLDLLWNESLSRLYLASRASEIPVVNGNLYELKGTTALDLAENVDLGKLSRVSEWLGVQRLCVFLTPQSDLLPLIRSIFTGVQIDVFPVSEGIESPALEVLVRKQIAPFGFTSFLILLPPLTTKLLLLAFHSTRLTTNRLIVLLSSKASIYRFNITDGELAGVMYLRPLHVTSRECSDVETAAELLLCQVSQAVSNPTNREVSLMQIANRTGKCVGWIHGESIDLSDYQEAEIQPNISKALATIRISINSGRENPSGLSYYDPATDTNGAIIAQQDLNTRLSILPYFKLEVQNVSLGVDEFDAVWVQRQLAKSNLGVVLIDGIFSPSAIGVYEVLRSVNHSIPQVGAAIVHSALSSISQFPLFTRVVMADTYIAVIYARVVRLFGWRRVNVLFANDTWDEGLTEYFFDLTEELGIEVVNRNNRIPSDTQSNSTELLEILEEVVESKVRVLAILAYGEMIENVLVGLYNLGMRSGDLILVAMDWLTPSLYEIEDSERLKIVTELTQGALMFIPSSFVGPIGASVYQKYIDNYGQTPSIESCFYYDAMMIIAHALDDMSVRGVSWFSATQLNRAIRKARFVGCTGLVYIEEQTNNRALMSYAIVNARLQVDGAMKVQVIGTYDPSSTVIFNFTEAIQWPGGGASIPTEMRENLPGCPFEQKDIADYRPALGISAAIISCVCFISISSSVFIWRKYWNEQVPPITTRVLASFEDYFVYAVIAIEAVQSAAVGLELCDWAILLKWSANLLAVRFEAVAASESAGYWCILYIAMSLVILWAVLLTLARFKPNRCCQCICSHSNSLAQTVCPVLGELGFLPIVSSLLAIFQCPKITSKVTESTNLYNAYLEWDCNQYCWRDSHLPFAIFSFVCLLVYIPSAVFMRPAWQHVPLSLHIHASPSFLMLKSIYQVAIASVDRVLKTSNPLHSAVVFVILTFLFGIASLKAKAYNYSRASMWHFLSLLFILHTSVLHIASDQFPSVSSTLWLVLLFLGLSAITVFGLVFQAVKLPVKLRSRKSIHVTDLFRFMFARDGRYLHIFTKAAMGSSGNEITAARRVPATSNLIK